VETGVENGSEEQDEGAVTDVPTGEDESGQASNDQGAAGGRKSWGGVGKAADKGKGKTGEKGATGKAKAGRKVAGKAKPVGKKGKRKK
jgi:hypothetical protein